MEAIWTRDIRLARLRRHDCEMLRQWRNAEHIRRHMFYQEVITPEAQKSWFDSLRPEADFYYMITADKPIGLIHVKDLQNGIGNAGLFIHDQSYWGSPFPVLASLTLLTAFFSRNDIHTMVASVRPENLLSKEYNEQLGFHSIAVDEMVLDKSSFYKKVETSSLLQILCKVNPAVSIVTDAQDQTAYNMRSGPMEVVLHRIG
ncbi:MAG: GNAT family N-acetyltransferase [Bacteroidota bacterium]|nr:GNAT family N-acetyltransferase [Bacteroidota bacterium]MEC8031902.1 GNAT family N-acetyltransferase [Bacteroidota bacterium]MEC8756517.1 GNAT family N-acetyltransferase [Bacteroidota bacterium]MEC8834871.1 GNAT family N-acetyltransferase [Bacteroidota bacterium]MEC9221985.1 GNAT family N-acetyltransferase [Bacteroidota bacterium]